MDERVTLGEILDGDFVGVSESDSLADTAAVLADEGAYGAVALRGTEPVGTVTATDVLRRVTSGEDLGTVTAGDVATEPATTLSPDSAFETAAAAVAAAGNRPVVVVEGGEVVGMVEPRDLVAARASLLPTAEPASGPEPESRTDAEPYSDRSICEVCGGLASDLSLVNGQLVCSNCMEV